MATHCRRLIGPPSSTGRSIETRSSVRPWGLTDASDRATTCRDEHDQIAVTCDNAKSRRSQECVQRFQVPPRTRQTASGQGKRVGGLVFSSQGLRAQIRSASRLLTWVEQQHDSTISDLAQGDLEHYLAAHPGVRCSGRSFVIWLGTAGRTRASRPAPTGTAAPGHHERRSLLPQHRAPAPRHHHQQPQPCRRLFLLLFAWPLNRSCR
jgi:hypothetical protein